MDGPFLPGKRLLSHSKHRSSGGRRHAFHGCLCGVCGMQSYACRSHDRQMAWATGSDGLDSSPISTRWNWHTRKEPNRVCRRAETQTALPAQSILDGTRRSDRRRVAKSQKATRPVTSANGILAILHGFLRLRDFDLNVAGCDIGQPPSYFDPYTHPALQLRWPHAAEEERVSS